MFQNYATVARPRSNYAPLVEEFKTHGCTTILRRVEGPYATEFYFSIRPTEIESDAEKQASAMYKCLRDILMVEGGDLDSIVSETIFFRDISRDVKVARVARNQLVELGGTGAIKPAITEIQQPPLDPASMLEISVQAILPKDSALVTRQVAARSGCTCSECEQSTATMLHIGNEVRLVAGGLCGDGDTAYEQTKSMFELAEKLLQEAGMEFSDVVRTWIYLREMERDYPELNRARREFFESRGIDPVPASTGIEGGMVDAKHDLCLGFYAVKSGCALHRTVMTTPTLNEAGEYGADFTRGMRMLEANKVALHVSGTASIDETGKTAHVDDIDAQIDRMILNISTLLENQGADFSDIVFAYNYLKDPADEALLREKFKKAGLEGFPSVFVHAAVCRPDLLCETEVLAVLPREISDSGRLEQLELERVRSLL